MDQSYYLYRGSDYWYWFLSPFDFNCTYVNPFAVGVTGGLTDANVNSSWGSVAPIINLSAEYANKMIGDGTIGNEYRVEQT